MCADSWVYGVNFCGRRPVRFSGAVSLISWACWSWAVIYGGSLYVFGFWLLLGLSLVGPSLQLANWGSLHPPHLVFCHVGGAGCVEAFSSACPIFWGFSLAIVQMFVLGNFSTIELYFQIGPCWSLVWLPLPPSPSSIVIFWCFLCWWLSSSSRYTVVPTSHYFLWSVGGGRQNGLRQQEYILWYLKYHSIEKR